MRTRFHDWVLMGAVLVIGCGAGLEAAEDQPKWEEARAGVVGREYLEHGPFLTTRIEVGASRLEVVIPAEELSVGRGEILGWVGTASEAVTKYYGRFPVREAKLLVLGSGRGRVHSGVTYEGKRIVIRLGSRTREADLKADWRLTHEMFHLGFPDLEDEHLWMEEGLATYLEPLARVGVGAMSVEKHWADLVEGLPRGLPGAGDEGLNRTRTRGRTYWGGALFWLLADLRIREQTGNRKSVADVARAVLGAGGTGAVSWPAERVLRVGDRATGLGVLGKLYEEMGNAPGGADLDELWRRLGVVKQGRRIVFDEGAPLAGIRRGMTGGE